MLTRTGALHPATVPGGIHSDLLDAGQIPDPYYRDNETELFWIGRSDGLYLLDFDVPAAVMKHDRVIMRCEGLDTVATVTLNGATIAKTDNMFRTCEFDVKARLKPCDNRIEILFKSPNNECNELLKKRRPGLAPHISVDVHKLRRYT